MEKFYSQVELNRCAFLRDGAIEAQCEAATDLENGRIVAIDKANHKVYDATAIPTEAKNNVIYGINYTSEKIYDQFKPGRKNFYVVEGECPRVGILKAGDIFTTDAYILHEDKKTLPEGIQLLVVADTDVTNPDGSPAVKYQVL